LRKPRHCNIHAGAASFPISKDPVGDELDSPGGHSPRVRVCFLCKKASCKADLLLAADAHNDGSKFWDARAFCFQCAQAEDVVPRCHPEEQLLELFQLQQQRQRSDEEARSGCCVCA
jgi:hypothetical protein